MGTGDGGAPVAAGHGLRRDTGCGAGRHERRQSVRLDALDGVAVELLLVVHLLDAVVHHDAVQVQRLARAEEDVHRRADELLHRLDDHDVLPARLQLIDVLLQPIQLA